jgi:hypothetical protein
MWSQGSLPGRWPLIENATAINGDHHSHGTKTCEKATTYAEG